MKGRRVAITGVTSGIGHALAVRLAQDGAFVAGCGRRAAELASLRASHLVHTFRCDLTRRPAAAAFVSSAAQALGGLDALVCNAGLGQWLPSLELTDDELDRLVETNVLSVLRLCRAARPLLAASRGRIVLVGSALGHRAIPNMAAYAGTKAFGLRLAEGLRLELAAEGVRVTVVSPGIVETEFPQAAVRRGAGEAFRPAGLSADRVAAAIAAVLAAKEPPAEVRLSPQASLFGALAGLAPEALDEALREGPARAPRARRGAATR